MAWQNGDKLKDKHGRKVGEKRTQAGILHLIGCDSALLTKVGGSLSFDASFESTLTFFFFFLREIYVTVGDENSKLSRRGEQPSDVIQWQSVACQHGVVRMPQCVQPHEDFFLKQSHSALASSSGKALSLTLSHVDRRAIDGSVGFCLYLPIQTRIRYNQNDDLPHSRPQVSLVEEAEPLLLRFHPSGIGL